MIHFIVNPQSLKKKKSVRLLERIEAICLEKGVEYIMHQTVNKGDATAFAREITQEGENTVVVIGGDGMLNDVLSGIVHPEKTTLGLIPAGTGNDFATSAQLPYGEGALSVILEGEAKPVDFIQFEDGKRSMNIAGIGIDVDILMRCERMKVFKGRGKYFLSLIATLWKYKGIKLTIEANGELREVNAMIAAVCNGKEFGGGIPFCPVAQIDDGQMELVYVEQPKRGKILGALLKLMKGKLLTLPITHRVSCQRATITPLAPCTAQYDGELYSAEALKATLISGQLKMFRGGNVKSV